MTPGLDALKRSLGWRTRVAILGILVGLLAVLLAGGYFFARSVRLEEAQALAESDAIGRGVAAFILAREEGFLNILQAYAERFRFREAVKRRDRAEATVHLRQLSQSFPEMDGAFLADPAGVLWARYPESPELYGKSFAYRDWYQGVSRAWRPYVSEVFVTAANQAPGIALALPIRDPDGNVIGIIGSSQRLDVVRQWLLPIQVPNGDLYLVDRKGQLIFHRSRVGREHLSDYSRVAPVERLLKGEEGVAETENPVDGEVRLTAFRRLPSLGWGLVVYQEKNLALQRVRHLMLISGVAGFLLAGALGVLGVMALRSHRRTEQVNARLEEEMIERRRAEAAATEAKAEAERANQAKSEFLSRMSHEFRTPLNAILGFAQVLELEPLQPKQGESVGYILKAGQHLLGLIDEVLDIARIEAGRLRLSLEPVAVKTVLDEARSLIRPLAEERRIRLQVAASEAGNLYVLADRQRLKQVLLNLLANAVKYNREGGAVTLSTEEAPGNRLRFKVTDTGPGIPPERIERLFTPFERLGAEANSVEGTGLGLALSKSLAEAMGGAIGVESEVGRGSAFWVELPRAEDPEASVVRAAKSAPDGPALRTESAVLYIEDNLSNIKLIEHVLARRPQVRLLTAIQGRLGLDLARDHRPGLILLDLQLPDIPGGDVLRQLREDSRTRDIPVVILSADASPGQIRRHLDAGAREYLTKPIDVRKFLEIVDEVLRTKE